MDYLNFSDYSMPVDDDDTSIPWTEYGPVLFIYSLTFLLGFVGNVVIIVSTLYPRLRSMPSTPTNVFLGGLATADLLLIIFCIPVKIAKLFSFVWEMGIFLCKAVHYMQSASAICSVLTLTAMSVERYYAIVHPMRAQYTCTIRQARLIVMYVWFAAFALATPMIFVQTHKAVGLYVIAFHCKRDFNYVNIWRAHEIYMLLLVLVIPLIIMTFCYTAICREIQRVMKRRYHMTSRHALSPSNVDTESISMSERQGTTRNTRRNRRDNAQTLEETRTMKQVIKMLVAVVVLFAICWSPMLIDNVLTAYDILPRQKQYHYKHMNTAFQLMAYLNSCINPIIYGFMSKHFRESFLAAARGGWWRTCLGRESPNAVRRNASLSQTRTTSVRAPSTTNAST